MKKEVINLKNNNEGYMGGLGKRKWKDTKGFLMNRLQLPIKLTLLNI